MYGYMDGCGGRFRYESSRAYSSQYRKLMACGTFVVSAGRAMLSYHVILIVLSISGLFCALPG